MATGDIGYLFSATDRRYSDAALAWVGATARAAAVPDLNYQTYSYK